MVGSCRPMSIIAFLVRLQLGRKMLILLQVLLINLLLFCNRAVILMEGATLGVLDPLSDILSEVVPNIKVALVMNKRRVARCGIATLSEVLLVLLSRML
jgi:hypothetical protein